MYTIDPIISRNGVPEFHDLTNNVDLELDRLAQEDLGRLEPYLNHILHNSDPRIAKTGGKLVVVEAGFRFENDLSEDLLNRVFQIFCERITNQLAVIEGKNPGRYNIHHVLRFHREAGSQMIVPTFIQVGLFNTFEHALTVLSMTYLNI